MYTGGKGKAVIMIISFVTSRVSWMPDRERVPETVMVPTLARYDNYGPPGSDKVQMWFNNHFPLAMPPSPPAHFSVPLSQGHEYAAS